MLAELKIRVPELKGRLKSLRGIFDLGARRDKVKELEDASGAPDFWDDNQRAQGILKELAVHRRWLESYERLAADLTAVEELLELADAVESPGELVELEATLDGVEKELARIESAALLSGPDDHRNAILSIHPGAGGTESQDWADMLFRMYNRWAERNGFTVELMDYQPGDEAGLKSATLEIKGDYAFGYLKAESGVHRLVRISPFDAAARRHTSFVSVHVFPEVEGNIEIEIREEEVRIDTYRSSGAGGQHVNKTSSAIRLTHLPTGIVVTCQSERSQHKNKEAAFTVLKSRLYQLKREEEAKKMAKFEESKKKIEWGSQIRSYVFQPYQMVKDHRTSVETGNVQAVMDGDLEEFIQAFLTDPELNDSLGALAPTGNTQ
ncbi:MAG TPA: peptide chain release factor 2 [candidate division Zixibacteria bacterium]|nr:peptide chain release factor 2 [candidate division Zixibacteria bacterium]MDM7971956.1 peptide chain release factor 2 [candidate division Zixibacteria bacterium]HOD65623.1 peptide chain release factor 2 [candidate division Zixibacteria bacterium]HPI33304.1 peptide chain release factor 2 [candidate division Zixibacteria bacterium]HPM37094.1 peptide chain release factor 2 [candidate division Zixibacteria bacterium]